MRRLARERTLDEIAAQISGVDLILTEGFTRQARCRIAVARRAAVSGGDPTPELRSHPDELLAVAADDAFESSAPVYDLNDAAGLVDLIERAVLKQ